MLLAGFTGLFSIGRAAFLGVGAYTEAVLAAKGWPFRLSMAWAMGLAAAVGVIVGLLVLRVKGIYLRIATLAFGFICAPSLPSVIRRSRRRAWGFTLARHESMSFAISAALAGLGGALYAHKISFLSPDQFNIVQSIDPLPLVVIGASGSCTAHFSARSS
jgi:branched-chain amino acid transport system permease protein